MKSSNRSLRVTTIILAMALPCHAFLVSERGMKRPGWCPTYMFSGGSDGETEVAALKPPVVDESAENKKSSGVNDPESKNSGTKNPLRLAVLKLGVTEPRFTSPLNYEERDGIYKCAGCGTTLFDSRGKYNSGSGWPSFWCGTEQDRIKLKREWDGRVECSCAKCGGHLGHVFPDGPKPDDKADLGVTIDDVMPAFRSPGGKLPTRLPRFCVNGAALTFTENGN